MPNASKATLRFRPLHESDIVILMDWFHDQRDLAIFDRGMPLPVNLQAMTESWKAALAYKTPPSDYWFLVETEKDRPLGLCGLQTISYVHGDAILPFFVSQASRGKGLATAMTSRLLDMAFRTLRLHRVSTLYRQDNVGTHKVLKRLGFQDEGRVREGWYSNGKHFDIMRVGILHHEWEAGREAVLSNREPTAFDFVDNADLAGH
ncbi:MAG: GNAT family protein [Ahrensia sp.]|nr:GNAT family protein [Ahrensia sp.]